MRKLGGWLNNDVHSSEFITLCTVYEYIVASHIIHPGRCEIVACTFCANSFSFISFSSLRSKCESVRARSLAHSFFILLISHFLFCVSRNRFSWTRSSIEWTCRFQSDLSKLKWAKHLIEGKKTDRRTTEYISETMWRPKKKRRTKKTEWERTESHTIAGSIADNREQYLYREPEANAAWLNTKHNIWWRQKNKKNVSSNSRIDLTFEYPSSVT